MEKHYLLNDSEFETQFENASMDPVLFSHEAHLRLAWLYIRNYGLETAIEKVCSQIKQFDKTHGDGTKFNTTVTVASVKMVNHFVLKTESSDFKTFIFQNPRLKSNFKQLIDQHYEVDIFQNELARIQFLEPDLLPFD